MAKTVIKKEISIFLASSAELRKDREKFADFVMDLQKHYSNRGIGFQMEKWEYLDPTYNGRRKQDEYNDVIKKSDVFVALFHNKAGKYTLEEFDLAVRECQTRQLPLFIYFREQTFFDKLKNGTEGLKPITDRIANLQHFWGSYGTNDKLHLDFVLWLDSYIFDGKSHIKVENGHVMLEELKVAEMSGMSFAINNKEYQDLEATLQKLDEDIEQTRKNIRKYPDDSEFPATLSKKVMERDEIQKKLEVQQEAFLGTAKHIAELKKQQVNKKLQKAIDAFEAGQLNDANKLLEELEHAGERLIEEIDIKHEQMHEHIDALLLQTQTVMANIEIPLEKRIARVAGIYAKADDWANRSAYDKEKYVKLLSDYASFLDDYARYDEAERVCLRQIVLSEVLYGKKSADTASSYNNIGKVYYNKGEFNMALEYHFKAMNIKESLLTPDHTSIATSYNNIGIVYSELSEYDKALEYFFKALDIVKKDLGETHSYTALSFNNIGTVYYNKGDYEMALEHYFKALDIDEKVLGKDHPQLATYYNNIGMAYSGQGNYDKALEFYFKAMEIKVIVWGSKHPSTSLSYNNIAGVYYHIGDFDKALEFFSKTQDINEEVLGLWHPSTARSYNNIGMVYSEQGECEKALGFYFKALDIHEKKMGINHPSIATSYNNIGMVYYKLGEYDKALEYFFKALAIDEKVLGTNHPDTATEYNNIGLVFHGMKEYDKALEYHFKALAISEKLLGNDHPDTATSYNNIGTVYKSQGNYDNALAYYFKTIAIVKKKLGVMHPYIIATYNNIGDVYISLNDYDKAREYYKKAEEIRNRLGDFQGK